MVNFAANDRSQQVVDDPAITDKYMHLYQNQIPYAWQTIVDETGTFYGIYNNQRKNFFTIIDSDDRTLVNSAYLRCGDRVFTNFDEYWRGYFFDVLYDYEYDFYQQELPANDYIMDESLKSRLEALTAQYGDRAGRVFVVARMK